MDNRLVLGQVFFRHHLLFTALLNLGESFQNDSGKKVDQKHDREKHEGCYVGQVMCGFAWKIGICPHDSRDVSNWLMQERCGQIIRETSCIKKRSSFAKRNTYCEHYSSYDSGQRES